MHQTANPIDIIGFQEEKVHTGILAWMLDKRNASISPRSRHRLLRALWPGAPSTDIAAVTAYREYTTRRRRRIDLVVKIEHSSGDQSWVVVECKTDSVVKKRQLKQSREDFRAERPHDRVHFVVLLLGAARFTGAPNDGVIDGDWHVVDLDRVLAALEPLPERGSIPIVSDWCEALRNERVRDEKVLDAARRCGGLENDEMRRLGYRMPRPVYYSYYHHLRRVLDPDGSQEWAIYNGGYNAVMNCTCNERSFKLDRAECKLYWEFNDQNFCLKVGIPHPDLPGLPALREHLQRICDSCSLHGHRAGNRRAKSITTVYKWPFDFGKQRVQEIAQKVQAILRELPEQVAAAVGTSALPAR